MVDKLSSLAIFSGINPENIPEMLKCLKVFFKDYQKNELIVLESDEIRNIGIILSGTVHMIKIDENGEQTILVSLKKGELFGESFSCGSHLAACVSFISATDCKILFLPFHRVIHSCKLSCVFHHRLIENMVRIISDKNVMLMHKIEIISKKTLREKIMTYLHLQAQEHHCNHFTIPLGRLELAEFLCDNRSALTRELVSMQKEGLIRYHKNTFEIL